MKSYIKTIIFFTILFFPFTSMALDNIDSSIQIAHENIKYAYWAFLLGGLSAVSLPLGSLLGIVWKPSPRITATFTAFGAGALLAALSIELVAPTVQMVVENNHFDGTALSANHAVFNLLALIIGCILGGIFFFILNEMLNSKGGYLRKMSTTITHLNHLRFNRYKIILKKLSRIDFFREIPKNNIQSVIGHLQIVHFKAGNVIFNKGEIAGGMYIIEHGEIELKKGDKLLKTVKAGEIIGEISLLRHVVSSITAVAKTDVRTFELLNDDFDKIRAEVPELELIIEKYAQKELDEVSHFIESENSDEADEWSQHAINEVHHSTEIPSEQGVKQMAKSSNSAPLAIWLGIFLDGIPESFVIGAGFLILLMSKLTAGTPLLTDVIPYTLIAGLFLSNFPEAMSSSIGMRKMGWKISKILLLWISLMIMTATGAIFGFYFSTSIPETFMIGVEGLAAGAMLTMIAQTMIPEAVHIGGPKVVGLATLAGYLSAVGFKIFE